MQKGYYMTSLKKETIEAYRMLRDQLDELAGDIECAIGAYNDVVREVNELHAANLEEVEAFVECQDAEWHDGEDAALVEGLIDFFEDELNELDDAYPAHDDQLCELP